MFCAEIATCSPLTEGSSVTWHWYSVSQTPLVFSHTQIFLSGLKWTNTNDMLVSVSLDSVRMWERKTGVNVRTLKEAGVSCCANPLNDNVFLVCATPHYFVL